MTQKTKKITVEHGVIVKVHTDAGGDYVHGTIRLTFSGGNEQEVRILLERMIAQARAASSKEVSSSPSSNRVGWGSA